MDQQQQQMMEQQVQQAHSNLVVSPHLILTRSDSTSSVILDGELHGEHIHLPASLLVNRSLSLRSLLKTSGLFNEDLESADKLNELFANGTEFTLHRLLSDFGVNDMNIDMNDLFKSDPMKLLDARSFSEFSQCDLADMINNSSDIQSDQFDSIPPSAIACSSGSFFELCPVSVELPTKEEFLTETTHLKLEPENPLISTELDSLPNFVLTPSTTTSLSQEFTFDPRALAAMEHDYNYLVQQTTVVDTPTPSPIISKRTPTREARRTSSRLQSRAALLDVKPIVTVDECSLGSLLSPTSSISSKRTKSSRQITRATDIKTEDDLSYYLERRRKNNEASKLSRAARKQKFGDMDLRCAEYERANAELRLKIATLEVVTANLKDGLIHTFQRKTGGNPRL